MYSPAPNLACLPCEVIARIGLKLPASAQAQLRLVSQKLSWISTPLLFQSVTLKGHGDSSKHFINIALSTKLRTLVRKITCNTRIGSHFTYRQDEGYVIPFELLQALEYLRFFHDVQSLHIYFSQDCGISGVSADDIEETPDFRFRILDTVFHCLAGTWSSERQDKVDKNEFNFAMEYPFEKHSEAPNKSAENLNTLAICNLADYNDTRLTNSNAFRKVLASEKLVNLNLFITTETEGCDRDYAGLPQKHEMFETLPSTWLMPCVAAHLRELALYCQEWWGWSPKMDFRMVGNGHGLPHLKTLALGKYVFSHEWQVEWVASLNLEELYLDCCGILRQAQCIGPLDNGDAIVGQDSEGKNIITSKAGYQRPNWIHRLGDAADEELETSSYPLEWHGIFDHWRGSMPSLRVFKTGVDVYKNALGPGRYRDESDEVGMNSLVYLHFDVSEWQTWDDWLETYGPYDSSLACEGSKLELENKDRVALGDLLAKVEIQKSTTVVEAEGREA